MTKLIAIVIVLLVLYGGWNLFLYYDRVKNEEATAKQEQAAAVVTEGQLSGVPQPLETSLAAAREQGAAGLTNWLKTYAQMIQDPRRAWIELDYVVLLSRSNPAEARRIFADVKQRTGPTSPVWQRIKQLQQTYE